MAVEPQLGARGQLELADRQVAGQAQNALALKRDGRLSVGTLVIPADADDRKLRVLVARADGRIPGIDRDRARTRPVPRALPVDRPRRAPLLYVGLSKFLIM